MRDRRAGTKEQAGPAAACLVLVQQHLQGRGAVVDVQGGDVGQEVVACRGRVWCSGRWRQVTERRARAGAAPQLRMPNTRQQAAQPTASAGRRACQEGAEHHVVQHSLKVVGCTAAPTAAAAAGSRPAAPCGRRAGPRRGAVAVAAAALRLLLRRRLLLLRLLGAAAQHRGVHFLLLARDQIHLPLAIKAAAPADAAAGAAGAGRGAPRAPRGACCAGQVAPGHLWLAGGWRGRRRGRCFLRRQLAKLCKLAAQEVAQRADAQQLQRLLVHLQAR